MMHRFGIAVFGAACLAALAGCGGESHDVVAVTGTVTHNDQPVEGATVAFHGGNAKVPATGITDASGKYKLTSYNPGDGAPAGSYKVTVTKQKLKAPVAAGPVSMEDAAKTGDSSVGETNSLPGKYASQESTPLTATVEKGKTNDVPLKLTD